MKKKASTADGFGITAAVLGLTSIPAWIFLPFVSKSELGKNFSFSIIQSLRMIFSGNNHYTLDDLFTEIKEKVIIILLVVIIFGIVSLIASIMAAVSKKACRIVSVILYLLLVVFIISEMVYLSASYKDSSNDFGISSVSLFSMAGVGFWINFILLFLCAAFSLVSAILTPKKEAAPVSIVDNNYNNSPVNKNVVHSAPIPKNTSGLIIFLGGNCSGYQIPVHDGEEIFIGKDVNVCSVCIDKSYTKVSRKHCGVKYISAQDIYIVTDYSTNGTIVVGGSKLGRFVPTYLTGGTVLNLAKTENSFKLN